MDGDENAPLLHSGSLQVNSDEQAYSNQVEEPPPYRSFEDKGHELEPPPYTWAHERPTTPTPSEGSSAGSSLIPHINCRVCQTTLSVEGKMHLHVIKCYSCGEATPIRPAPPGKKYVRCPCNCLLICKVSSQRIVCPRSNCKRVITLEPVTMDATNMARAYSNRNPTRRITCGHCNATFLWVRPGDVCDHCPHCNRLSSFGVGYKQKRMKLFFLLFLACLIAAIVVNISTLEEVYDKDHLQPVAKIGYPVLWGILYLIAVIFLLRSVRVSRMVVSTIERRQYSQYGSTA